MGITPNTHPVLTPGITITPATEKRCPHDRIVWTGFAPVILVCEDCGMSARA